MSILSICVDVLSFRDMYVNISPEHIFITDEGSLKLNHLLIMD